MRRRSVGRTCRATKPRSGAASILTGQRAEDARADRPRLTSATCCTRRSAQFNPKYKEAEGALVGELQRLNADIAGNRDFLTYLRNQGKFFNAEEKRELDLNVIDYDDIGRPRDKCRNVYEVTEEFYVHNGQYGTREDVVFLINGIPVLVIECKNATQGRGDRAGRRSDPPLPRRDAGGDGAADGLHRHRGDRLRLRRDVEH